MATPTLGSVPTTLGTNGDADALTGWTVTSGAVDTELKKEGTGSVFGILRNDLHTAFYDIVTDGGSAQDMTGLHVRCYIWFNSVGLLDTEANNGMEFYMYDGTNTAYWVAFGSDTYTGGWYNAILDCDSSPDSGSVDKTNVRQWGWRYNRTAAPRNVDNTWIDAMRTGDGYYATGGTSGDKITLSGIASVDATNGYGILELVDGVYFSRGELQIGNGATTTWFEMDGDVLVFTKGTMPVNSGLYKLIGNGSGANIVINNSTIRASSGAVAQLDMDEANINDLDMATSFIALNGGAVAFKSGQVIDACIFDGCGQITHGGADMTGSTVQGYEGTANTSALIYNVNADPDGEMDDMFFTKGTAATHAIEFGTTSPLTMTLRGITFSGYNATSGANNDTTFHVKRTSGTVTINLIGCSGNMSYRTDGATVNLVISPVTTTFTVEDSETMAAIENARVLLYASSGTGDWDYQAAVTSITRSGSTATVTTTGNHALTTNDYALIEGANQDEYNGSFQVTVTGATTFTYTVPGTPTTPATGTITMTGGMFNTLTNSSGVVTDTRSFSNAQPFEGTIRKGGTSPLYKSVPISGTISTTTGYSATVLLSPDE